MLLFEDLATIFPDRNGMTDLKMEFYTISAFANIPQPKGIFIPLYPHSGELTTAIENGAIAAVWKVGDRLPSYTPNDFPVFLANDLWEGLKEMIEQYGQKLNTTDNHDHEKTKLVFLAKNSLKEKQSRYDDKAVIERTLCKITEQKNVEGRE